MWWGVKVGRVDLFLNSGSGGVEGGEGALQHSRWSGCYRCRFLLSLSETLSKGQCLTLSLTSGLHCVCVSVHERHATTAVAGRKNSKKQIKTGSKFPSSCELLVNLHLHKLHLHWLTCYLLKLMCCVVLAAVFLFDRNKMALGTHSRVACWEKFDAA